MNFSFTRNSSFFATSYVCWACALETCDFFSRGIASLGISCPMLAPTLKGGCMVLPEPLVEGSGSLLTPNYVVELV